MLKRRFETCGRVRLAASGILAALAGTAQGGPTLMSATSSVGQSQFQREIALSGPVSIEAIDARVMGVTLRLNFDEPLTGVRAVAADGANVDFVDFQEGRSWIEVDLSGVEFATSAVLTLDVASGSGVLLDTGATLAFLPADLDGSGYVSQRDAARFVDRFLSNDPEADLNADGIPSQLDVAVFVDNFFEQGRIANRPPTISEIGLVYAGPNSQSLGTPFTLRDDFTAEDDIQLSVSTTAPDVLPASNVQVLGSGGERTIRIISESDLTGAVPVTLTATDARGASYEATFLALVDEDEPPTALVTSDTYLGVAPLTVELDASDSFDRQENIVAYDWDLGGQGTATGPGAQVTFNAPGTYTVTCTVTDDGGLTDVAERIITVAPAAYDLATPVSEAEARRFLWQAGFGPRNDDVAFVMASGFEAWIDNQLTVAGNYMSQELTDAMSDAGRGSHSPNLWDNIIVEGDDQLRQKIAWSVVQIIAINERSDEESLYSLYIKNAMPDPSLGSTGNYREMLHDITFNEEMGDWLTYEDNRKADPVRGTEPDQNYAREVIQLFSVGLWDLTLGGVREQDAFGEDIPAFDPAEAIAQFARIFTGFNNISGEVMEMRPERHEFGPKQLLDYPGAVPLNGFIPAQPESLANALSDVELALDNIFFHPSTAPFISRQLIQRMVTANPTPGYVARVTEAFEGNGPYGTGVRGDMFATVKALLLDDEARNPAYRGNPFYGRIKEPLLAIHGAHRVFQYLEDRNVAFPFRLSISNHDNFQRNVGQGLLRTPTVFNFYEPTFTPLNTPLSKGGFAAPEVQIMNDNSVIEIVNQLENIDNLSQWDDTIEAELLALAPDADALVDRLDMMLNFGTTPPDIRQIIVDTVNLDGDNDDRVEIATVLMVCSLNYRVLR